MLELLQDAAALARPAISGFCVGAVARGRSGKLYLGGNLEFAGVGLEATVHAEQAAVINAWAHDEDGILALAVSESPCGACRQFLYELENAETLCIVRRGGAEFVLGELLPGAFGPRDLGGATFLMGDARHGLHAEPRDAGDELVLAAFGAANRSHAPYGHGYAGVALRTSDGATHTGRYAESAAFNPSVGALQAALVRLASVGTPFGSIEQAVLVEAPARSSQRAASMTLLAAVAPKAVLTYIVARSPASPAAPGEAAAG